MAAQQQASQWHLTHLLKWLHMFDLQHQLPDASSLSDGVTVAKVLSLIDPPWFHETWISKIKQNVGSNVILKVSNWKKVLERLVDYYEVRLDQRLSGFTMPDVNKIAESEDEAELCRLLQLVLGCAVHCERQEEFIQAILQMEEDVQRGIMAAIQELPGIPGDSLIPNADSFAVVTGRSPNRNEGSSPGMQNLLAQLESANEEKKLMAKERQQLNLQITTLQDEIQHLQADITALKSGSGPMESLDRTDGINPSPLMQKREIQRLTDELLRSDAAREEFRIRCEALEQDLDRMKMRQDDLESAAEQTRSLKDEVDILRERSAKLENAQSTIDSMRRKVEEGNELKRQLRKLEEKNSQYIQQNMELEEELKKLGPWKSQLELQKKQIAEVQSALDEERRRADKLEIQFKNQSERNEALVLEKERLIGERDKLVEQNEEFNFKFAQLNNGAMVMDGSPSATGVDTLDMIPPEIREKLLRLQHENRLLREKKGGGQEEAEVLQTVNAELLERNARLDADNRCEFCRRSMKSEVQGKAPPTSPPSTGVVASLRARLASKPVFAGHIVGRTVPTVAPPQLVSSASCSQLGNMGSNSKKGGIASSSSLASTSGPTEVKMLSHVERLKNAFLSGSSVSSTPTTSKSRPFLRSVSQGFSSSTTSTPSSSSIEVRKWADSESETKSLLVVESNRNSLLVTATKMESKKPQLEPIPQKPPPPPVDAVVITRESSPRDETDSGYRGGDSIHYESSSPRSSPDELMDRSFSKIAQQSPPDDSIEVDASFRAIVRGSVDSESVSVSSFSIISSDRSFERSESLLLTPRSTLHSEDTSSRKSFGKSLKKRKMFKAAANAMFSLCGP